MQADNAAKRPVVMIRNGVKLCAACRDNGCDRNVSGPNIETEYVSAEPCECCELDIRATMASASDRPAALRLEKVEAYIGQALDALIVGQKFLAAYREASASDEEGLLMAIDPEAMRTLWAQVDEAAEAFHAALLELEPKETPNV